MKLKVMTHMKLHRQKEDDGLPRKVRTVMQLPKIQTIIGGGHGWDKPMAALSGYGLRSGIIGVIDEEEASRGQDDSSESGRHSSKGKLGGGRGGLDTPSDEESGSGEDSSIDGDLEQNE